MYSQSISLTQDVLAMMQQYHCTANIVPTKNGHSLSEIALSEIEEQREAFNNDQLAKIYHQEERSLRNILSEIIRNRFASSIDEFKIYKNIGNDGQSIYKIRISLVGQLPFKLGKKRSVVLNISKLISSQRILLNSLMIERPGLCWLLDSRSPLFEEGLDEMLEDLMTVTSMKERLQKDLLFQKTVFLAISKQTTRYGC